MSAPTSLKDLPGLGPASQKMLEQAGITSVAQLQAMGAVACFVQVRRCGPRASLNLLWALESALTGEPWQEIARTQRTRLLLEMDAYEQQQLSSP